MSVASQVAKKATSKAAKVGTDNAALSKGAKRDPELYILFGIMAGAFGLAGFYFGRKPTSSSSEAPVSMAHGTMPWETENGTADSKYQYHPRGDASKPMRQAPSALNTVIVPNVNLPKSLHDQYNKWGKDGY